MAYIYTSVKLSPSYLNSIIVNIERPPKRLGFKGVLGVFIYLRTEL